MWDQRWNTDPVCKSDISWSTIQAQFGPQACPLRYQHAFTRSLGCIKVQDVTPLIQAEPSLTKVIWIQHMSLPSVSSQMWRRPTLCHLHSLITSQMLPLALCARSNLDALAPLSPWGHNVDRSYIRSKRHMHQSIIGDSESSPGL